MNFFGHAAVARWHGASADMAFGAMLPDFASMCGGAVARIDDAAIATGVALHHTTDAAFHRLPGFLALCRGATERLRAQGVTRGPARGAAHVGVELLLDGELTRDDDAASLYVAAIAGDRDRVIAWRDEAEATRWRRLAARLAAHGVPLEYRDPDRVSERVAAVLGRRARLAPTVDESRAIAREMRVLAPRVAAATQPLMDALASRLAPDGASISALTATLASPARHDVVQ